MKSKYFKNRGKNWQKTYWSVVFIKYFASLLRTMLELC